MQLDQTVPGGRYRGTDGSWHDANGKPLPEPEPVKEPEPEPVVEPAPEPVVEQSPESEPVKEPEPEPVKQPVKMAKGPKAK